ncbi:rCG64149 [Rattus norvegicus]|uniref:RCG64149 n=1 Tax=Rattus norvegicus TaxID=10116 RepID=A6JMX3_RAT|nr:rCG64149 [Rattus norvegicus]
MEGPFGGGMKNMGRFGSGMNMGRINEILSNALKRGEIIAKQGGGRAGGSVPGIKRMGPGIDRISGAGMEHMGAGLGHGMDRVGSEIEHMSLVMDRMSSIERMGSGIECMGPLSLDHMASSFSGGAGGHAPGVTRKACQIFVRKFPFDFTWKMLKDKFNECGHVLYTDIKMENGKSKGYSVLSLSLQRWLREPAG